MHTQLRLPMRLRCANPGCREYAPQNEYWCSQSCYEAIRTSTLTSKITWGERRAYAVTALLAGLVIAAAAFA